MLQAQLIIATASEQLLFVTLASPGLQPHNILVQIGHTSWEKGEIHLWTKDRVPSFDIRILVAGQHVIYTGDTQDIIPEILRNKKIRFTDPVVHEYETPELFKRQCNVMRDMNGSDGIRAKQAHDVTQSLAARNMTQPYVQDWMANAHYRKPFPPV